MKFMVIIIPLVEFNTCFFKIEYVDWSQNRKNLKLKDDKRNLEKRTDLLLVRLLILIYGEFACSG